MDNLKKLIDNLNIQGFKDLMSFKETSELAEKTQQAYLFLAKIMDCKNIISYERQTKIKPITTEVIKNTILEYAFNDAKYRAFTAFIFQQLEAIAPVTFNILNIVSLMDLPLEDSSEVQSILFDITNRHQHYEAVATLCAKLVENQRLIENQKMLLAAIRGHDYLHLTSYLTSKILQQHERELLPLHLLIDVKDDPALLIKRLTPTLDVNLIDGSGNLPIHIAIMRGHKRTVGKLAHISRLDCKNKEGFKPVELAAKCGYFDVVKLLYRAGADISKSMTIAQEQYEKAMLSEDTSKIERYKHFCQSLAHFEPIVRPHNADKIAKETKYIYGCFKGGGIKGIAYLGAINEGIAQGLFDLNSFLAFAGTSAGAITATLLALRIKMPKLEEIMKKTDFTTFFDWHDKALVDYIIAQAKGGVSSWKVVSNYFTLSRAKELLDTHQGVCKGDAFLNWIQTQIAEGIKNTPLAEGLKTEEQFKARAEIVTFRDLHDNPNHFANLVIYGSNVNTGHSERYCFETTPDMCVADAVRISMSLPFVFDPHKKHIVKNGKRQLAEKKIVVDGVEKIEFDNDLCVDGGLFYNYPVGAFDFHPESGDPQYNDQTIGFCLLEPDDHEHLEHGKERISNILPENSALRFAVSLAYSTFFNQQGNDHQKRTIYINTRDVGTTEFDLDSRRQQMLIDEGKDGVRRFIARQHDLPEKALSSEISKKLFSLGLLPVEKNLVRLKTTKALSAARIFKLYACADDSELHYLKMLVNPNIAEEGVTALQIARAYEYPAVEERLLKCNANTHVDRLEAAEIEGRVKKVGSLIKSRDNIRVKVIKKLRLKEVITDHVLQKSYSEASLHSVKTQKSQLEEQGSAFRKELSERDQHIAQLTREIKLLQQDNSTVLTRMDVQADSIANVRQENALLAAQLETQKKHLHFTMCRHDFESRLRNNITTLRVYKKLFVDGTRVAGLGFVNEKFRMPAKDHCESWCDQYALSIMNHFLDQLPVNLTKSEDVVKSAYIASLQYLLKQLEDKPLQAFVEAAGKDYASFVNQYIDAIKKQIVAISQEINKSGKAASFFSPRTQATQPPTSGLIKDGNQHSNNK